jgi:thiamine-phosphate pyrophosphorylase
MKFTLNRTSLQAKQRNLPGMFPESRMKLIVLSSPTAVPEEHSIINSLFEEGLEIFHIHKPFFSKEETENFIQEIPSKYRDKIALHSDFPKFHSLSELEAHKEKYEYAFLSPLFDSISKVGYKSKFSQELHPLLRNKLTTILEIGGKEIIALGGIDEDKIKICRALGFAGVAVLGALWNNHSPVQKFKQIQKQIIHIEQARLIQKARSASSESLEPNGQEASKKGN